MTPPGELVRSGIRMLPCLGDGRRADLGSPSILKLAGGGGGRQPGYFAHGDKIKVDLKERRVDVSSDAEIAKRRASLRPFEINNNSPWESFTGSGWQLKRALVDFAVDYHDIRKVVRGTLIERGVVRKIPSTH